jgi:hypothetical protein
MEDDAQQEKGEGKSSSESLEEGHREHLVSEVGYFCVTGHILNVEIYYGKEGEDEGFFFEVEDDNYKNYNQFMGWLDACLEYRLSNLRIEPTTRENRVILARKLLELLKLENSNTDGRKLYIMFNRLPEQHIKKSRSPSPKRKDEAAKKRIIRQILPPGVTPADTASHSPPASPAKQHGPRRKEEEVAGDVPQNVFPEKVKVFSREKYFGTGKFILTIYEEDSTLLVVATDVNSRENEYQLLMHDVQFAALGLPNYPDIPAADRHAAHETVYGRIMLEASDRDGLKKLILVEAKEDEGDGRVKIFEQPKLFGAKRFSIAMYEMAEGIMVTAKGDVAGRALDYELLVEPSSMASIMGEEGSDPAALTQDGKARKIYDNLRLIPKDKDAGKSMHLVLQAPEAEKVVYSKSKLFTQEKRFGRLPYLVTIFEEEDILSLVAVDKSNPGVKYETTVNMAQIRNLHDVDSLRKLSHAGKAELCEKVFDRVELTNADVDGPRKLIVHRHRRHTPKRAEATERKRILRIIAGSITPQATPTGGVDEPPFDFTTTAAPGEGDSSTETSPPDSRQTNSRPDTTSGIGETVSLTLDMGSISSLEGLEETSGKPLTILPEELEKTLEVTVPGTPTSASSFELFSRVKSVGPDDRVIMVSMYDEKDSIRVSGSVIFQEELLEATLVSREDLEALGCNNLRELTLDQKIELCEKLFECVGVEQPGGQDKLCINVKRDTKVTLLTRGKRLGKAHAYMITIVEDKGVITVHAEDVFDKKQTATLTVTPADLARLGGANVQELPMNAKLDLCDRIFEQLDIRMMEDGVTPEVVLDDPHRTPDLAKTVSLVYSCADPLFVGSPVAPVHISQTLGWTRITRPGAAPAVTKLFSRLKTFGDRRMMITIYELPPTGVVAAVDAVSQQTQYLILDAEHFRSLGLHPFGSLRQPAQKTNACEAIFDHLTLVSLDGSRSARLALQGVTSPDPTEFDTLLAVKDVPTPATHLGTEIARLAVYDTHSTLRISVRIESIEYHQLLSPDDLDELGYGHLEYLDEDEKKEAGEQILAQVDVNAVHREHSDILGQVRPS